MGINFGNETGMGIKLRHHGNGNELMGMGGHGNDASHSCASLKGKGSPYSIAERRVPELIPVLGRQPTVDVIYGSNFIKRLSETLMV